MTRPETRTIRTDVPSRLDRRWRPGRWRSPCSTRSAPAWGGIIGPYLFAKLVETGELSWVALGYYLGAAVMILGGLTEVFLGVNAEQKSLEDIAEPLSAQSVR